MNYSRRTWIILLVVMLGVAVAVYFAAGSGGAPDAPGMTAPPHSMTDGD
jgi:hypothetical protein